MNAIRSMRNWVASGLIGTSSTKQNPWSHFINVSKFNQKFKTGRVYNMAQPNMKRIIVWHNIVIFDPGTLIWIHDWGELPSMASTSFHDSNSLALSSLPGTLHCWLGIWRWLASFNTRHFLRVRIKPGIWIKPYVVIRPCSGVSSDNRRDQNHAGHLSHLILAVLSLCSIDSILTFCGIYRR